MESADFLPPGSLSLKSFGFSLGDKTSPVKNILFLSFYLPHLHNLIILVVIGL
ncbi:hypothetical protein BN1423_790002 [Carnobacterium maltaromaticum]|nr:hypothetical protein BN1423_790002 [Carnobacterium maltaromaticum]